MSRPELVHLTRTSMTLQWRADAGAEGYEVHRTKHADGEEEHLLAYVHPFQTMFSDPGLEPGTEYAYRVVEVLEADQVREAHTWRVRIKTEPETEFASVEEFVTKFIATMFRRELSTDNGVWWCDQWWRHEEAVIVLKALWWSYEQLRPAQPPEFPNRNRADFLVYHCYPLMSQLFAGGGCAKHCEPDRDGHKTLLQPLPQLVNPTSDCPAPFVP